MDGYITYELERETLRIMHFEMFMEPNNTVVLV